MEEDKRNNIADAGTKSKRQATNLFSRKDEMTAGTDSRADDLKILNEEFAQEILYRVNELKRESPDPPDKEKMKEFEERAIKDVLRDNP